MLKSNSASTSKVEDSSSGSQLKILPNLTEDSSKVKDFTEDSSKVEGCTEDSSNQDSDKISGSSHDLAKVSGSSQDHYNLRFLILKILKLSLKILPCKVEGVPEDSSKVTG